MNIIQLRKSNLRHWSVLILAALMLSGCNRASQMATEVIAGKGVADKMAQSEGTRDRTAKAAQAEAARQKDDARIALGQHLYTSWVEFRAQPNPPLAGQNAVWTMNIWKWGKPAKNNNWVDEFKYNREKLLHVVVVSNDLSYFNHFYPDFRGDGLFIASQILPFGGNYKIFADFTPMRGVQEVAQHEFRVDAPNHIADYLWAEPLPDASTDGWIVQRVVAKPDGEAHIDREPNAPGSEVFSVALQATSLVAETTAQLRFRVQDARQNAVALQPFLGDVGYLAILSADTKIYLNATTDANEPSDTTSSTRNASADGAQATFQTVFPAPGIYKIWAQFQTENGVLTAPFVVRVADKQDVHSADKQDVHSKGKL